MRTRSVACVPLAFVAALGACESLTTPEKRSEELQVFVALETSADSVTTGDTLDYVVAVLRGEEVVLPLSQRWFASDNTILRVLNDRAGRFEVRKLDTTDVNVEVIITTSVAGEVTVVGKTQVEVLRERFYGTLSGNLLRFRDLIAVAAPPEQPFTDSTQIVFRPDGLVTSLTFIPGIVLSRQPDSLIAVVPAGFARDTGSVLLTEIAPDGRDLASRTPVARAPSDRDEDPNEPNDIAATPIAGLPVFDVLSVHDAADVDRFVFDLVAPTTLTFELAWNVPANLDYRLFKIELSGSRTLIMQGTDTSTEAETAQWPLDPGRYEVALFVQDQFAAPTTYFITIQ